MKKILAVLSLLPLLVSCGMEYQNSYNEEIRSMYPAYYYEASMEGFSNLHEKKDNYLRVVQDGYYESTQFYSENYDPDYFPEIYEILKTSPELKKRKYDSGTEKTFYYEIAISFKKTDIILVKLLILNSLLMKDLDSLLSTHYMETMTTGSH